MSTSRLSCKARLAVISITSRPSKPIQIRRFHSTKMSSSTTPANGQETMPGNQTLSMNQPQTTSVYPVQDVKLYRYRAESDTWSERTEPWNTTNTNPSPNSFALITWNVDFARSHHFERLETSLNHLQSLVEPLLQEDPPIPSVIVLQEVYQDCFPVLLKHPFVRAHYDLTDISSSSWSMWYGVVTLAPKTMNTISAFRSVFEESDMGREGLFIDIAFPPQEMGEDVENKSRIVRVANTHLESLDGYGDTARPIQLGVVASFLSAPGIYAGIVGGDMNPIGLNDDSAPGKLGFLDAWIECKQQKVTAGSAEKDKSREAEGHTWGYQPHVQWPPRRMDKVLFLGNARVKDIRRFGVGLTVHEDKVGGEKVWASDHYGLLAEIEIV